MNETNWYDALGVKPDEAQADDEPAEVTEQGDTNTEDPQIAPAEETGEGVQGTAKQSRQENARYAAARRKAEAERDAAIAKAKADAAKEQDQLIADMGLKNPYTKQPITTRAEYDAYKAMHAENKRQQVQRRMDLSDDEFKAMVDELPEVKEAKARAAEAEQAEQQRREQEAQAQVERELANITAMNPNIKSAEDLSHDPKYQEILQYINMGHGIDKAYRIAHMDDLSQGVGRQQALNAAGKAHMTTVQTRGAGAVTVPSDELYFYRALNPGVSDEEIARHFGRVNRGR